MDCLDHLRFAVFGLGDSSYELFNYAGKKLYRRLAQLGATPLCPRGDGDDQHKNGIEGALVPFLVSLWDAAEKLPFLPKDSRRELIPMAALLPVQEPYITDSDVPKATLNGTLIQNKRISEVDPGVKDVRHLIFKTDLAYEPGDVVNLWPQNDAEDVKELLKVLGWESFAQQYYDIEGLRPDYSEPAVKIQKPVTLWTLLQCHLDIVRVPSRYFFTVCSKCVDKSHPLAQQHREKLEELSDLSEDGIDPYIDYVWRPKRRPVDVLLDFESLKIPLEQVFDLFPWIKPRSFSIASWIPGEVHVALAVAEFRTIMKKRRLGLCSNWLSKMEVGKTVPMEVKPGSMHLPDDNSPIVLMCAGTGIAPMRAFLHKISQTNKRKTLLFFGCRNSSKDALFMEELSEFSAEGWLEIFIAGSREQAQKVYLADILLQHANILRPYLNDPSCHFYLSGNSKLPSSVKSALSSIIGTDSRDFSLRKRFHSETWS